MQTREEGMLFLREHNKEEGHIRHALAVEAVMRYFAKHYGQDVDLWGLTGLMHDIDWEQTQTAELHPMVGAKWLEEKAYPAELIRAVLAHGWDWSGVEPLTEMEKTLYTVDELSGFVTAVALVRPSKSLMDLEVKSVKKKWKDKAFAKGVDRGIIEKGCVLMDKSLDQLIEMTIEAMRPCEKEIGLGV